MKSATAFLRLIRLPNLLIVAFTQYMVRWCILRPGLNGMESLLSQFCLTLPDDGLHFIMSDFDFFLLSLSWVMMAAAGYIINDYFDVKIDRINKPDLMIIDKGIRRRVAMGAHIVINVIAFLIGLWLSWKYNFLFFGSFIYAITIVLLWFYSTNLKRMFLLGNLVVSMLTAFVPLIVALFELPLQIRENGHCFFITHTNLNSLFFIVAIFSLFAFAVTLLREIIKDIEDYEGDKENGCNTLPVALGISLSKKIAASLTFLIMALLAGIQYQQFARGEMNSFWYFTAGLQVPFLVLALRLFTAQKKKDFTVAGGLAKLIMLSGICYLFLYNHFLMQVLHANQ